MPKDSIQWVEGSDYLHPAQDFKMVEKGGSSEHLKSYVAQYMPVNRTFKIKDKKGNVKEIQKTVETCVLITSDHETIIIDEEKKVDHLRIKVMPSTYGGKRWSRSSIQATLAKKIPTPHFLEIYEIIQKELRYYFELEDDKTYDVITSWAIGTYFHELFNFYPILYLNAAKGSGKTKLLNFLHQICFNAVFCQDPSDSTIFRLAHANKCTILIDEIETIGNKDKKGLRSLLLGSPNKGIIVPRAEQTSTSKKSFDVKLFDLYGPRALANIRGIDDVLEDRCITIILKRALNKEIANREINTEDPIWQEIRDKLYELLVADEASFRGSHALRMLIKNFKLPEDLDAVSGVSVVSAVKPNIYPIPPDLIELFHTFYTQTDKNNDTNDTNNKKSLGHIQTVSTTLTAETAVTVKELSKKSAELVVGRNLNVWKPIMCIGALIHPFVLFRIIQYTVNALEIKKADSDIDNIHVTVVQFLVKMVDDDMWFKGKNLLAKLKEYEGFDGDWVNAYWFGRTLKTLGFNQKRRVSGGREYFLNLEIIKNLAKRFALDYQKLRDEAIMEKAAQDDGSPAEQIPEEILK